jgi:hypothetical protein
MNFPLTHEKPLQTEGTKALFLRIKIQVTAPKLLVIVIALIVWKFGVAHLPPD